MGVIAGKTSTIDLLIKEEYVDLIISGKKLTQFILIAILAGSSACLSDTRHGIVPTNHAVSKSEAIHESHESESENETKGKQLSSLNLTAQDFIQLHNNPDYRLKRVESRSDRFPHLNYSRDYTYDSEGRLIRIDNDTDTTDWSKQFEYDSSGVIISHARITDLEN